MNYFVENIIRKAVKETVRQIKRNCINEAFKSNRLRDWFNKHGGVMKEHPFNKNPKYDNRTEQLGLSDFKDEDIIYWQEFDCQPSQEEIETFSNKYTEDQLRYRINFNKASSQMHNLKKPNNRMSSELDRKAWFTIYKANDMSVLLVGINRNNVDLGTYWSGEMPDRIAKRRWNNEFNWYKNSSRYHDDKTYNWNLHDTFHNNNDYKYQLDNREELRKMMTPEEWEEFNSERIKGHRNYYRKQKGPKPWLNNLE